MKRITFIKTVLSTVMSSCVVFLLLFNQAGCNELLGTQPGVLTPCGQETTILGPDVIYFDPCEPTDVTYNLWVGGNNELWDNTTITSDEAAQLRDQWNTSGGLSIVSVLDPGPVTVQATQAGQATISFKAAPIGECPPDPETNLHTYATKTVTIVENKLTLFSTLCQSSITGVKLTVLDKVPGAQNYEWSIAPEGAATITPQPGTPDCLVENILKDFTVTVLKIGSKCKSSTSLDVTLASCQ